MSKIKIISNPYKKMTVIEEWDIVNSIWKQISYENNTHSKLVSDDIRYAFFQFKADEIVEGIYADYHNQYEKIQLSFEGTEDDYMVLEKICNQEKYAESIVLERGKSYLENASDVLPKIKKIFSHVEPLVEYCVSDKENVRREMKKFTEASDDCIPIVVLGNYSSGKSTFINSLLGSEILPSGGEPVTAKIYKISKSETSDRAHICCYYHNIDKIEVNFTTSEYEVVCDSDNELKTLLNDGLKSIRKNRGILVRVAKALSIINSYENDTSEQEISDLIEVVTPFHNGILSESKSKFVIFDTPGSNSASNTRHLEVLRRAMEDMSNGIPMFVSVYDSLDSTDNVSLYTKIKEMPELDSRFTMIVVNKADNAGLDSNGFSENKIKSILNWSVPKNLYSEGIFFVSSIMGLGAKTKGKFENDHYDEVYVKELENYKSPNSRHKKCLYKYNIMPDQLKKQMIEETEAEKNLVYANSGIFSVELGLESFATNYSSYNKCEQSRLFLTRIIEITEEVIKNNVEKNRILKEDMLETLEETKKSLLTSIIDKSDELTYAFETSYTDFMEESIQGNYVFTSIDELKNQESETTKKYEEILGLEKAISELSASASNMKENINIGLHRDATIRNAGRLGQSYVESKKDKQQKKEKIKEINKEIEKRVSDEMIETNKNLFIKKANDLKNQIENDSREKWAENTNRLRRELSMIITGSSALTSVQRDELTKIIIEYGDIDYETKADKIFTKDTYLYGIRLGNLKIGNSSKIRLEYFKRTLNSELTKYVRHVSKQIKSDHEVSFKKWCNDLIDDITENITDYSSKLHSTLGIIRNAENSIYDYESKQQLIKNYSDEIEEMISWRTEE